LRLQPTALVAAARRRAGWREFGAPDVHGPLCRLIESIEDEAQLNFLGRIAAREDLGRMLVNRLELDRDYQQHPEIAAEQIRRPLFITGLPRSGSTLLHSLLAQDPANRVPLNWETMYPSPPPEGATHATDPRADQAERQIRWFGWLQPEFCRIHPVAARQAEECVVILSHSFLSSRFHTTYRTPSYQAWLKKQDRRPAYAYHRRFLEHLQWRTGADRWVLKAPAHLYALDALFAIYPDALVVQTHRDPRMVLGSVASLTRSLQSAFAEPLDPAEIGREVMQSWTEGLERGMHVRRTGRAGAERFFDVRYQQLLADPIGTVREIYRHFELPLTVEAEHRMRSHLRGNPQHKHGRHAYDLKAFGLDGASLDQHFGSYREFFGIEPEFA